MADERSLNRPPAARPTTDAPDDERVVSAVEQGSERSVDYALRPQSLAEMLGQERLRDKMQILVDAARHRGDTLDHVLLYGPPGLGKCITADSLIETAQGLQQFATLLPVDLRPGAYAVTDASIYGVAGPECASHVYANGRSATLRMRTRSGFVIEGTPNHPLLVATPQGPQWKPLAELGSHDFVAVARGIDEWGAAVQVIWHPAGARVRSRSTERKVLHYHAALTQALGRAPTQTELRHAYAQGESGNPTSAITAKRLGLAMSDGRRIEQAVGAWKEVTEASHAECHSLTLDADLAYLLGVLVGDGHIEHGAGYPSFIITADETAMQGELQRIARRLFGAAPIVKRYGAKAARLRFAHSVGQVMLDLGVKPVLAGEKEIPQAVLCGPRAAAIGFLQGLFDADGSAWPDGYIEFGSRSQRLTQQVQILLAKLGIIAQRTQKVCAGSPFWTLFIGGNDAQRFFDDVGFRLARKQSRSAGLALRSRAWSRADLVPAANPLLCALLDAVKPQPRAIHKRFDHARRDDRTPTRASVAKLLALLPTSVNDNPAHATLQTLLSPAIYWDRVASIEASEAETFDFVVPGTHSFVANGFYNHNTTLSHILAHEMNANLKVTAGPAIEKAGDLAAILTNLRRGDILFIDEIHRLGRAVEEILYPAMEDFALDLVVGSGPGARNIRLSLPKFTVVGATTRLALLTSPLRARFGVVERFDFYDTAALQEIVKRAARMLELEVDIEGALEIARRSRGTPRIALRLLRRVRDFAQVRAAGHVDLAVAREALALLDIDWLGLDDLDRRVLDAIVYKFNGGPVGLDTLAASISEESDTIMDVVEPYLLQMGFLDRTPRGRLATRTAYAHLGAPYPDRPDQPGLFS